ncbi:hypothetical protein ACFOY4_38810 [Actinomadura syzygii]|uniref:Uncharacterized protein n=1 Tax=Actinomadura syzygii TaxID=1427538 RepID=A0A5D0U6W9_9ACTN|nr:hypothetical protein [Actinomadura syzygii]TYC14331.1 hypothetical protein FXF65_15815 [Actinomadura syzygii]
MPSTRQQTMMVRPSPTKIVMTSKAPGRCRGVRPWRRWKPESRRSARDRFKGLFGDDETKSRKLAGEGVPRDDPMPPSAKAAPANRVKELTGRRTANAKVFELSDELLQKKLSAAALHLRGRDGDWHDIDPPVKAPDRKGFVYGTRPTPCAASSSPASMSRSP